MKLSTRLRYGARALVELAQAYPAGATPLREIAEKQHLSVKYLEQLMAALKTAGLVKAARGVYGGYALTKEPSQITIWDVYRVFEGPPVLAECADTPAVCPMAASCPTRGLWSEMSGLLLQTMEATTLQDLLQRWAKPGLSDDGASPPGAPPGPSAA